MAKPALAVALGDTVLYVDPYMGDIYPAIVTKLLAERRVQLTAFQPGTTPFALRGSPDYSADKTVRGTYHLRGD